MHQLNSNLMKPNAVPIEINRNTFVLSVSLTGLRESKLNFMNIYDLLTIWLTTFRPSGSERSCYCGLQNEEKFNRFFSTTTAWAGRF